MTAVVRGADEPGTVEAAPPHCDVVSLEASQANVESVSGVPAVHGALETGHGHDERRPPATPRSAWVSEFVCRLQKAIDETSLGGARDVTPSPNVARGDVVL